MTVYHIKVTTEAGLKSYCNTEGVSLEDTMLALQEKINLCCQHSTKESAESACDYLNKHGLEAQVIEGPCDQREPYYDSWETGIPEDTEDSPEYATGYSVGHSAGLETAIQCLVIHREAAHRTVNEKNLIQFLINELSELTK